MFSMADIKPLEAVASKWASVTPGRAGEYAKGILSPRRSWAQATEDAKENYAVGVQAAIAAGRFEKGVSEAGDSAWKKGATEKGVSRWPQGVSMSKDEYRAGFARYHSVISGLTLSPRGAKGDPRNYDRVREIGEALHAEKVGSSA